MSKNLDVAVLLDFYGAMLTDKQRDAIDLYYNQDLSLSEIAELQNITRQGVRDSIKRGGGFLYYLEDKLHMFETYIDTIKAFQEIGYVADRIDRENSTGYRSRAVSDDIGQIKNIVRRYLETNT